MQKDLKLYVKSMGKVFRVRHVALNDDDANRFCQRHNDCGVIAVDTETGLVYIAEIHGLTIKSDVLPD